MHNCNHHHTDSTKILLFAIIASLACFVLEMIGAHVANSIALQSDAVHMLTDSAGLVIAYFANIISKKPATVNLSFGYGRAEALGAITNCLFSVVLTSWLLVSVIKRFFYPSETYGAELIAFAAVSLVMNAVIVFMLSKDKKSLNTKAAMIHSIGDLMCSFVTIVAGIVVYYTKISIVDPILSLIVIAFLIVSNFSLIKQSLLILMSGVPSNIIYNDVVNGLKSINGITNVHDLHIWHISNDMVGIAAHIVIEDNNWSEILPQCQSLLINDYKINHITLQHEINSCNSHCEPL